MKLILGTMNFGPQVNIVDSAAMLREFFESGNREVDTAYVYNSGDSERFLGRVLGEFTDLRYTIATKVNPRVTGFLDEKSINMQVAESLKRLNQDSIDILYLHFPDPSTPIEDTLQVCAELHKKGAFKELGLSNYPAWLVVDIWHLCKERNWPQPTIYQGMYNGLSRKIESELFPALRRLGIRFYAYNPLAGGILSEKYSDYDHTPTEGRFTVRPNYLDRYWKKSFFQAIDLLRDQCNKNAIHITEAAYRWLAHHSSMDMTKGDGIVLGASKLGHLKQNISALLEGPLPAEIVNSFEQAWEEVKSDSPEYFRFYRG